jgi:uncharacterized protein DUF3592
MRAFTVSLLAIVAVAFLGWQVVKLASLEARGIRAEGQIVRSKEERHFNHTNRSVAGYIDQTNYHAIVKFRTQDNQTIEFEDFAGDYLPIFQRPGTTVTVLYLASNPLGSAIIDRGPFWNWVRLALSPIIYFR